jgi:hypothetical protein
MIQGGGFSINFKQFLLEKESTNRFSQTFLLVGVDD